MDFIEDTAYHLRTFFYSMGLGALLSAFYSALRLLRKVFSFGKILTFVEDFLFVMFCTIVTFIFVLAINNGIVRGYIYLGEFLGFAIYCLTMNGINFKIENLITSAIKKNKYIIKAVYAKISRENRK